MSPDPRERARTTAISKAQRGVRTAEGLVDGLVDLLRRAGVPEDRVEEHRARVTPIVDDLVELRDMVARR